MKGVINKEKRQLKGEDAPLTTVGYMKNHAMFHTEIKPLPLNL